MIVLLAAVRPIVSVMSTPAEAVEGTIRYLTICFIGIPFITAYNIISAIFRGIGDLKITLISSFVNMGLRVLVAAPLVLVWGFGIEALPFSYLAGWIGMLVAELPLLIHTYRESKITG